MKTFEKVIIAAYEKEVVKSVTCDLCDKVFDNESWDCAIYKTKETSVYMELGSSYHGGGDCTKTEFHICPSCFETKLMVWLNSQKAQPTITELDW